MKKVFIHAGLHKTGTTAIQKVLFENKQSLLHQNFYYPHNGIPHGFYGHHNLAWQLSRDRRFRSEFGDLKALLKEIVSTDSNKIILSSEDFECSLLHPYRWKKIIDYLLSNNLKVCFVIYLRKEIDYLVSLYCELLKAGFDDEFTVFYKKVISQKKIDFKEWEFIFNYSDISSCLSSFKEIEVIFRDYDEILENNSVVDFCDVVGIDYKKLEIPQNVNRINEKPSLRTLLKLFVNNRVYFLPDDLFNIVNELCGNQRYELMPSKNIKKKLDEVSSKNLFFKNKESVTHQEKGLDILNIERVFSFETFCLILNLKKLDKYPDKKNYLISEWHKWVKITI